MSASLLRSDALRLPLADDSVDLIVTSPPYWALRSYVDGGEHYQGQIGSEETPGAFLEALWAATEEMARVLKPSGSIWVNLGDKYAGCFDTETEALTGRGWLGYDQIRVGDRILTLGTTYQAEWGTVEAINVHPAMTRRMLSVEGRGHSSLSTPDHRWFTEYRTGRPRRMERRVVTSAALSTEDRVPTAAPVTNLPTEPKWSDALVELIAWYWTEGSDRQPGVGRTQETGIYLSQSHRVNPLLVERIDAALRGVYGAPIPRLSGVKGAAPAWRRDIWPSDPDKTEFRLNAAAARLLREHAPSRRPRPEWLCSLTAAQLRLYVDTALDADGWRRGDREAGLAQKDRARAELFQMACILNGNAASLSEDVKQDRWIVQVRQHRWLRPLRHSHQWVEHDGIVWCPTTSTGTWLARRHGQVFFTGNSGGHNNAGISAKSTLQGNGHVGGVGRNGAEQKIKATLRSAPDRYKQTSDGVRNKSLLGLPWRYAIGCIDGRAGEPLILRSEVVWSKPNGLPESVTDRVRRSHEQWFMFTKSGRYYSAIDEIREPYNPNAHDPGEKAWGNGHYDTWGMDGSQSLTNREGTRTPPHPLGKLPGSVWEVPSEPLIVPDWATDAYELPDHFAAFPQEWPRRIILGWSPSGICLECGEGRRPVVIGGRSGDGSKPTKAAQRVSSFDWSKWKESEPKSITGEACACPTPTAPTQSAVVLDPFGGTGTVAMVARALGRFGISVDLSADYLRLARWRIFESGHAAKSEAKTWAARQGAML